MFSRNPLAASFALAGALFAAAGCGKIIGEQGPSSGMTMKSADVGCLSGASKTFADYFNGTSSEAQMASLWSCAEKSIRLFAERTRGDKAEIYSPDELRRFLENHFLKTSRIPDGLMSRAMELKTALLGGAPDTLTRGELERAVELIMILREKSLRLRPFMPLTADGQRAKTEVQINEIVTILEDEARALGDALRQANYPYSFASLEGLVAELDGTLPSDVVKTIRRQVPFFQNLKGILVPSTAQAIGPTEWPETLRLHAKLWGFYLRSAQIAHNAADLRKGEDRKKILALVEDVLSFFEEAARRHPGQVIPFDRLEALVAAIDAPTVIRRTGLKLDSFENVRKLIRPGVRHMLGGARFGKDGREADGLGLPALSYLRAVLARWDRNQALIERLEGREIGAMTSLASTTDPEELALARYFGRVPVLYAEWSKDRAQITIPSYDQRVRGFNDLSQLNLWREVSRMVISGYALEEERARAETGLDQKELRQAYEHFRDIGIELKVFDPFDPEVPEKRFREASIFTYSANGDGWIQLDEFTELLAFSLSAKSVGDSLHARIAAQCYKPGEPRRIDIYGQPEIEPDCFFKTLYLGISGNFPHVPWFTGYVSALSAQQPRYFEEFHKYFEGNGRKSKSPAWVNSGDTQALAALAAYLESMFARFDGDRSGSINQDEADRAFPLFKAALSKVLCTSDEGKLRDAFDFVMKNGSAPEGFFEKVRKGIPWIVSGWFGRDRKYDVDRVRILKILYEFSHSKEAQKACK